MEKSDLVKYGNTIISSRKDETFTYSRYVKNMKTGKGVDEELDGKVNVTDELETGQIKDGAVTKDKLANGVLDGIVSSTEETLKGKFLPLSGGTMTGPIVYEQIDEDTGNEQTATFDGERMTFSGDGVSTSMKSDGVEVRSLMPGQPSSAVFGVDSLQITRRTFAGENNVLTADGSGVTAEGFKTNDQSIQGLLANDGSVAEAVSQEEINDMFNDTKEK